MNRTLSILIVVISFCMTTIVSAANNDVHKAQELLQQEGYSPGSADGVAGKETREAIRKYQKDHGLPVTGELDAITKHKMGIKEIKKSPKVEYYAPPSGGSVFHERISSPTMKCPECEVFIGGRWKCVTREAQKKAPPGTPSLCH